MRVQVIVVGRAGRLLQDAIAEYEARAARYWSLQVVEVREEKARGANADRVKRAEGERILQQVAEGMELVALTRGGSTWSSTELAGRLDRAAVEGRAGLAFAIGGALGLGDVVLERAACQLQLSSFTLPHELARLLLAEQLYRAGTISRGEPYHKGAA